VFVRQTLLGSDSLSILKKRKMALVTSNLAISSGSLIYLNQIWYKPYRTAKFHLFNDNAEWFQVDKCGHAYSTYQSSRLLLEGMAWAGYKTKQQVLVAGFTGIGYLSAIEMMDGFSSGWGFSWGDMAANSFGVGLLLSQKMIWNQQRIQLKFSFQPSQYASYNPKLLGETSIHQILKDYNGQIYWLSINPSSFIKKQCFLPPWLCVAFGYGANGMIGARNNNIVTHQEALNSRDFHRYRQGYLSLDIDLTKIKTKSKLLRSIFICLNGVKIPFPNLELSNRKIKFNYY
jgi:hypothetical protein